MAVDRPPGREENRWWPPSPRVRDGLLGLLPVALTVCLGLVPLAFMAYESVSPVVTLTHYATALQGVYPAVLVRSLLIGVVATVVCLTIAYPITYWIAHVCPARYRLVALIALVLPLWLNYVVLNYTWVWILARGGVLNYLLVTLGPLAEPLSLLYTRVSLLIGFLYVYLPYVLLTMYASMERLDYRLIEAARDLGAGDARVFLDIVLPRTVAGAVAGALIVYARIAGAYATPAILGGPQNQMIARLIVNAFYEFADWGFASALSFVFLAVVVAGFCLGVLSENVRDELRRW
jgi:ABC-type spermidine/putrescine transport system permease subunit I